MGAAKHQIPAADVEKVIGALENPGFTWRTLDGLVRDTGLDERTVRAVLNTDKRVIKSDIPNKYDEDLYSTYRHYEKNTPLWRRVWAAIRG